MNKIHEINSKTLHFETIKKILFNNYQIRLSESAKEKIVKCREYLDRKMETSTEPIYGVNTGFGALCDHKISKRI